MPLLPRSSLLPLALVVLGIALRSAQATPSTAFWAPSTPAVQPFGVLHGTYDTYFRADAAYPIDVGLTMGVLPWKALQAEVGFDLFYPSVSGDQTLAFPIVLNAKIGSPEDVYFQGQPAWSAGIFGAGLEPGFNDVNVLYLMLGKTFPYVGTTSVGGYYGLNRDLLRSAAGGEQRAGVLASWLSPAIDLPVIDKLIFAWDIQTGKNVLGATGGGAYVYLTKAIDVLTGPVFFFDRDLQPNRASWMWTVQLDVDLALFAKG